MKNYHVEKLESHKLNAKLAFVASLLSLTLLGIILWVVCVQANSGGVTYSKTFAVIACGSGVASYFFFRVSTTQGNKAAYHRQRITGETTPRADEFHFEDGGPTFVRSPYTRK